MDNRKALKEIDRLIEKGDLESALDEIEKVVRFCGDSAHLVNKKAAIHIKQKKYDEAHETIKNYPIMFGSEEFLDKARNLYEIYKGKGDFFGEQNTKWFLGSFGGKDEEMACYANRIEGETYEKEELVLGGHSDEEVERRLADLYLIQNYYVESAIFSLAADCPSAAVRADPLFVGAVHCKKIIQALNKQENIFVLVESADQRVMSRDILLNGLSNIGMRVYYIRKPLEMDVEGLGYEEEDLMNLIFNNQKVSENIVYLTPLRIRDRKTKEILDTTEKLLTDIVTKCHNGEPVLLLADKACFKSLMLISNNMTFMQISTDVQPDRNGIMLYQTGKYASMYSELYNFNIQSALDTPNTCKISIVIPTRNCPETLRYTLLSCLDQDYEDYEIVLSDNGDPGDEAVLLLAEELNAKCVAEGRCPKIKYYHTPGLLPLPKSFEYAYLRAQGDFLFGLGSDDALMPGSLRVLARCLDESSGAEVVQWNRNAYFWPSAETASKDRLTYITNYKKGEYETAKLPCAVLFQLVQKRQMDIYALPLCYINSGMRRSYLKRVIEKTGTLIGGACQDVYMAVVNLYLLKDILLMKYPVTMSGQSGKSIGIKATLGHQTTEERQKAIEEWNKMSIKAETETISQGLLPITNWDMACFYNQLLRVRDLQIGRLPGDEDIDFKWIFAEALKRLNPGDLNFSMHITNLVQAAKKHGEEFEKWFMPLAEKRSEDQSVGIPGTNEPDKSTAPKSYREQKQPDANGHVILDASNYGISDIYAAVRFVDEQIASRR